MSSKQQNSRINDVLYEIHRDIAAPQSARELSRVAAYSPHHFHRVFAKVVGESVNHYIRRTRLEQAANQLMFDTDSTIVEIAQKCGFLSLSSFGKKFKQAFGVTPGQWRSKDRKRKTSPFLSDPEIAAAYLRIRERKLPPAELVTLSPRNVAYVRHQGYGRSIRLAWHTLQAWAVQQGRSFEHQIGLHHSNPAWVPLAQCRYVACIELETPLLRRGVVNSMVIPGGLHAAFELRGHYGELLPYLSKILEQWLPASGFKMQTTPALVKYQKNHFLDEDEQFQLTFYLPISML